MCGLILELLWGAPGFTGISRVVLGVYELLGVRATSGVGRRRNYRSPTGYGVVPGRRWWVFVCYRACFAMCGRRWVVDCRLGDTSEYLTI